MSETRRDTLVTARFNVGDSWLINGNAGCLPAAHRQHGGRERLVRVLLRRGGEFTPDQHEDSTPAAERDASPAADSASAGRCAVTDLSDSAITPAAGV